MIQCGVCCLHESCGLSWVALWAAMKACGVGASRLGFNAGGQPPQGGIDGLKRNSSVGWSEIWRGIQSFNVRVHHWMGRDSDGTCDCNVVPVSDTLPGQSFCCFCRRL